MRIVAAVCDALAYAHARRLIHRDVKPENIILTESLDPVLIDFGLAVEAVRDDEERKGAIVGSPGYMSPEQVRGEGDRIDARTDIYSLGVVLYQMVSGRQPYPASDVFELLRKVCEVDPPPLRQLEPRIPSALSTLCAKAMAKSRDDRYLSAQDMAQALHDLAREHETGADAPFERRVDGGVSTPAPVTAQRRQVTALSCRLSLLEADAGLDPEDMRSALTQYVDLCRSSAQPFEGYFAEHPSEGLMVYFGYPLAHEDAAERAARAAAAMLRETERLSVQRRTRGQPALGLRVGIHTGLVVAEEVEDARGARRISIVGDPPRIAAALHDLAGAGEAMVSAATHLLIERTFVCEAAGERTLPGHSKSSRVFKLVRARGRAGAALTMRPLVAREHESGLLRARWEQVTNHRGQVVLLCGEAGVGKSRLLHALRSTLQSEAHGWSECRCSPYHTSTALYPLTDLLWRAMRSSSEAAAGEKLAQLEALLERHEVPSAEAVPALASLLSIPLGTRYAPVAVSPEQRKRLALEAMVSLLMAMSEHEPQIFVVEDLHWVDPSTVEFLSMLVERAPGAQLLVLLTYRQTSSRRGRCARTSPSFSSDISPASKACSSSRICSTSASCRPRSASTSSRRPTACRCSSRSSPSR